MPHSAAEALSSSPDPLNDSPTFSSAARPIRQTRARKSLPLYGSSPTKQTFELDVGNELSPQKIRVTVEAESNKENSYAAYAGDEVPSPSPYYPPTRRQNMRSTTTTVPLKGLSDSEDDIPAATPKQGRGRPRKSTGTPVPSKSKTRDVTPARRRRTLGELVDGDDEDDWDFVVGKNVDVGRGKGRSRSRSVARNKATPAATAAPSEMPTSNAAAKRGRRKSSMPEEVPILEDDVEEPAKSVSRSAQEVQNEAYVLEPTNLNGAGGQSKVSTISSTITAFGEDTTVAKFNLDRSPVGPGWSSPRVVVPAASSRLSDRYQSRKKSPPLVAQPIDSTSLSSSSRHERLSDSSESWVHEADDGLEDMPEFDTILESEGFSMISVDSVPSLREHLSSPPVQIKPLQATLSSSNSGLADKRSGRESSSSRRSSFLSDTAPSMPTSRNLVVSPSQISEQIEEEQSFSNNHRESQQADSHAWHNQHYDDGSNHAVAESNTTFADSLLLVPSEIPTTASAERPTSSRLLTPTDTPSPQQQVANVPAEASSQQHNQVSAVHEQSHLENAGESSMNISHLRSSPPSMAPPRYTYTAHTRQRRSLGLTETPSIIFSSPSLPPLQQRPAPREQLPAVKESSEAPKPELSSSLRAGRALQDIVVPISSSMQSSNLRSPFKSPHASVRRQPLSPVEDPAKEQSTQTSKLDSTVPGLGPVSWRDLNRSRTISDAAETVEKPKFGALKNIPNLVDDPFLAEASSQLRSPSPEEKESYTLDIPDQIHARNSIVANLVETEMNTVPSEDEMSWQVEYPVLQTPPLESVDFEAITAVSTKNPIAIEAENSCEDTGAGERESYSQQTAMVDQRKVYTISSDITLPSEHTSQLHSENSGQPPAVQDEDDDGEDIWMIEARNSSSPLREKELGVASKQPILEKPKRSKLPSSWRQNSKRLVYSDELAAQSSSPPRKPQPPATQQLKENIPFRKASSLQPKAVLISKDAEDSKSPAPILKPMFASKVNPVSEQTRIISGSSQRPQVPLTSKVIPTPPETSKASEESKLMFKPQPARQGELFTKPNPKPLGPARRVSQMHAPMQDDDTTELSQFWRNPQKPNFKPRITPRQGDTLNISALLASTPVKAPESAPLSPSIGEHEQLPLPSQLLPSTSANQKPQVLPEGEDFSDTEESQFIPEDEYEETTQQSNDYSGSVSDQEDDQSSVLDSSDFSTSRSFEESSRLSTTPTRQNPYHGAGPISPLKSCIRTPSAGSPSKAVVFSATTASSPTPASPRAMSASQWTKAHWLALRAIYWDYQKYPPHASEIPLSVKRSGYLGKTIYGNDDSGRKDMQVEMWHLDVVRMFLEEREEEGERWEEKWTIKRLYGMVVTEWERGWEREAKEKEEREKREEEEREADEEEAEAEETKGKGILGLGLGWL